MMPAAHAQREGTPLSPSPSPPASPGRGGRTGERVVIDLTDSPPPPPSTAQHAQSHAARTAAAAAAAGIIGGADGRYAHPNPASLIPDDPNQPSFYRTAAAHFPPPSEAHAQLEENSKAVVGAFYDLAVRAADVERGNEHLVLEQVNHTIQALANLSHLARRPEINATLVNPEALNMVDDSRNPDTHSRTLVNRLVSDNQQMRGQSIALHSYQSKLTAALSSAFPALAGHLPPVPDRPVWTESRSNANGTS
ncbi:unnamed protein product [Tilletia controversa]|uniref:Mediator of RNA polymerase II transcription subunit 10 n=1 Tax=Tilletia caries TaxID=13290 RepID=A0A177URU8_9BASI|nr:hypothetical protein CF336_g2923 [Tilletia laevis]KAE8262647.1 hypothetical protein A4X03_0g2292 [Tilletia caries]CAD6922155.1 unnamed protein product [Tilletia controversa]KAE8206040.1 hypothetical protein CF335_g2095 [Tilletia laevis]CAD6918121.1 unnamed protein product [Tilletia caries]